MVTISEADVAAMVRSAVEKERAACAKIAREEASDQESRAARIANNEAYDALTAEHRRAAASAERIARAIERGDR